MTSTPALLAVSLALVAGTVVPAAGTAADGDHATTPEPSLLAEGCVDATDGTILILPFSLFNDRFAPDCLVAESGEEITFENRDVGKHDPGDGREDVRELSFCFQATFDIPELHEGLPPGDTYSFELRFDTSTDTLYRETVRYNGDVVDTGTVECRDLVWTWHDDSTIAIPYICHIHPSDDARILLEV